MSERAAPKVVVDTNVFVSGVISPLGSPRRLLRARRERKFELFLSEQLHAELLDVLGRPKIARHDRISPWDLADLLMWLSNATRVISSSSIPISLRDPKDEPILAAALGGNADYLVTGDNDLLVHQGNPRLGTLAIVTVTQFLSILDEIASDG